MRDRFEKYPQLGLCGGWREERRVQNWRWEEIMASREMWGLTGRWLKLSLLISGASNERQTQTTQSARRINSKPAIPPPPSTCPNVSTTAPNPQDSLDRSNCRRDHDRSLVRCRLEITERDATGKPSLQLHLFLRVTPLRRKYADIRVVKDDSKTTRSYFRGEIGTAWDAENWVGEEEDWVGEEDWGVEC